MADLEELRAAEYDYGWMMLVLDHGMAWEEAQDAATGHADRLFADDIAEAIGGDDKCLTWTASG